MTLDQWNGALRPKATDYAALLTAAASCEEAVKVALEGLLLKVSRVLSVDVTVLTNNLPSLPLKMRSITHRPLGSVDDHRTSVRRLSCPR